MTEWNFDMSQAPRGRMEDQTYEAKGKTMTRRVFVSERILAAAPYEDLVVSSRWIPDLEKEGEGRWNMFSKDHPPVAWMPYPSHPEYGGGK